MNEAEKIDLYAACLVLWGEHAQIQMFAEECCECAVEALHMLRDDKSKWDVRKFADEVADVLIMAEQIQLMLPGRIVQQAMYDKLLRLKLRVEKAGKAIKEAE